MPNSFKLVPLFWWLVTVVSAEESHTEQDHEPVSAPASGGFLDPYQHIHFSSEGTPQVHSFGVEPAFLGRDLFLDYRYRSGDGLVENELELELEWAFTRRLGVIVEVPYIFEREDGGATVDGFGDLAIVPRAILLERDRFILSAQIEVETPTGTNGLGGETAIAPGLLAWLDLGDWWTLNTRPAVEHSFGEDETEFLFGFGLVKSIGQLGSSGPVGEVSGDRDHPTLAGLLNLHLEATGSVGLDGGEQGEVYAEGLIGLSYGVNAQMDLRVGYEFPLTSPREFDSGLVAGLVWHF